MPRERCTRLLFVRCKSFGVARQTLQSIHPCLRSSQRLARNVDGGMYPSLSAWAFTVLSDSILAPICKPSNLPACSHAEPSDRCTVFVSSTTTRRLCVRQCKCISTPFSWVAVLSGQFRRD